MYLDKNICSRIFLKAPLIAVALLAVSYGVASAHGTPFFELNPDAYLTHTFPLVGSPVPHLLFQPQNDFLNAIDLWYDNEGDAGTATFTLRNSQNSILASRTINIPSTSPKPGGTKLHIDFPSQVSINNTKIYDLSITSELPGIHLYYVNTNEILEHTSARVSLYLTGVVTLNGVNQDLSFKYSLYEGTDTVAPSITNLLNTELATTSEQISFNANEPVDFRVNYALVGGANFVTNYSGFFEDCAEGISKCSLIIPITYGGSYNYTLFAKDSSDNEAAYAGSFTIETAAPITPPAPQSDESQSSSSEIQSLSATTPPPEPSSNPPPAASIQPVSNKFSIGDRVKTTSELNVRTGPHLSDALLGIQEKDALGTITGGPASNNNYLWWFVNYDSAPKGWSVEDYLVKTNLSGDPISSPPPPGGNVTPPTNTGGSNPVINSGGDTPTQVSVSENNISVRWDAPIGGEPSNGYRVNLIGEQTKISLQFIVASGSHGAQFTNLPDDTYHIDIFANNGGRFTKIIEKTISVSTIKPAEQKNSSGFSSWLIPIVTAILLGGGLFIYRRIVF